MWTGFGQYPRWKISHLAYYTSWAKIFKTFGPNSPHLFWFGQSRVLQFGNF